MGNTKDFAGTGMSFLEYKDREAEIFCARANGSITREVMYMLLEDNRKAYNEWQEYRRKSTDTASMKEQLERMDEAQKFKDAALIRAKYGPDSFAKAIADVKIGGDR